ncbi:hypothetical protein FIBSPDRAFT_184406 [Athelia psychrophila]|uniref:Uncharacterized protein n=1 Tax=Athelia psychrophila TaxID=1759441 RepID=A0A166AFS1_9AGAM|nr:hypothetical protein FIBSPDRAFT_184406 [Fibularhizoctonia sp. CBS 109695]
MHVQSLIDFEVLLHHWMLEGDRQHECMGHPPFAVEEAVMPVAKDCVKVRSPYIPLSLNANISPPLPQMNLALAMEHDVLQKSIGPAMVPWPQPPALSVLRIWPGMLRGSQCASISRSGWHLDVVSN